MKIIERSPSSESIMAQDIMAQDIVAKDAMRWQSRESQIDHSAQ